MASLMLRNDSENFMNYMMSMPAQNFPMNISPLTPAQSPESGNQRIAPKLPDHPQFSSQQQGDSDLLRCKRRIQLGNLQSSRKSSGPQPAAVARRNERERNRVRLVNLGFANLRQHVPNSSKNKKMSKVDTLRSAVEYIKQLQELLGETSEHSVSQGMDENSYPVGGQSSTGSPTPSMCSEASSPYDMLQGDDDDDLMEFASWL
uniref:ASH2 protein n=1 Tax=Cupiennius salei TaxID=6928 RepID=Q9BLX3_CUPSA|nr:ASH2 protein [Cupiennius salei]